MSTEAVDFTDMPHTSRELRRIARRVAGREKHDSLDRIGDAIALEEIADLIDAQYELLRPRTAREREARLPRWLPGVCAMVVRRVTGARS